jgi:hypothetical protein
MSRSLTFSLLYVLLQMDDTIDYLSSHAMYVAGTKEHLAASTNGNNTTLGATIGMLWLDIEGTQVLLIRTV